MKDEEESEEEKHLTAEEERVKVRGGAKEKDDRRLLRLRTEIKGRATHDIWEILIPQRRE